MTNRLLGYASFGLSLVALGIALWGPHGETVAPSPGDARGPSATASPGDRDLERRVKSLEDATLSLSRRLMLLEQRPAGASDGGQGAPVALAAELEQLKQEVRGLTAGEALHSEGGREYLKDMMRSVQDEMRTEQREQWQQRFQQAQAQAQEARAERLRQFVTTAKLSYSQEQELKRRMESEETQRQALMDAMRDGSKSPRDARQELRDLRTQTDTAVKAVLDDSQKAQYDDLRREDFPQRGNRGGPGGPGGGGGVPF